MPPLINLSCLSELLPWLLSGSGADKATGQLNTVTIAALHVLPNADRV